MTNHAAPAGVVTMHPSPRYTPSRYEYDRESGGRHEARAVDKGWVLSHHAAVPPRADGALRDARERLISESPRPASIQAHRRLKVSRRTPPHNRNICSQAARDVIRVTIPSEPRRYDHDKGQ